MSRPSRHRLVFALVSTLFLGVLAAAPAAPPVQVSTVPAASGPWLTRFNAWRSNTATSQLTENTTWSTGDYDHALYMVKNQLITHYETPGTPYYTVDGDTAARNSNIYVSWMTSTADEQAIDWWMQAPFHAMGMMDPRLTTTGFGSYREARSGFQMGAAVDVLRGNPFTGGHFPVYFPGDGSSEPLTSYAGGEYPDPLQACSGYSAPTGLPVFIETGGNTATTAGPVHTFTGNGVALDHCIIDSTNPSVGSSLTYRGGVILIPRQPLQNGVKYTVALTVNGIPYTWSFTVGSLTASNPRYCTGVTATATPPSPSATGAQVTITAQATGCPTPQYRFWVAPPGGGWTIARDYSAANSFVWTTTGLASTYRLEVDVRDSSEAAVSYDAVTNISYSLNGCTAAGLATLPSSPRSPGGLITLTGTATCPGTPTYRFWTGQNGMWTIVQDYSTANAFTWNTAGLAVGTYGLEVDVRDQGATDAYEKVSNATFVLVAPVALCNTPTLTALPAGPTQSGSTVVLTAATAGCPTPNYRFLVGQNGIWKTVQDYSAASTFTWNTTGYAAGTYGLEVDVRDATSSAAYDHVANLTYAITAPSTHCTSAGLTGSPAASAASGSTPVFTASATGCPIPNYRFWVGQNGMWKIAQDYSPSATFSWNTAGYAAGTYGVEVDVRDSGSTVAYDRVYNLTYALAGCSVAHLSTDRASPEPPGTFVQLTGSATCPGTPEYRFWTGQNGIWKIVQDYSPAATYSWNTTGFAPGTYGLEVDVRDHGSASSYEAVSNLPFTVSVAPCSAASLSADKPSPQVHGTTIVLTGSATCGGTPQFRFWVGQNGIWRIVQDYGASNTFSWNTTGLAPGTYGLEVDVRNQGSTATYETVSNLTFVVT